MYFFFQAEDGIRDLIVTGVQTCALPICFPKKSFFLALRTQLFRIRGRVRYIPPNCICTQFAGTYGYFPRTTFLAKRHKRSEERRVGKESRSRWSPYH